jgi:dephospho-CoA kinase
MFTVFVTGALASGKHAACAYLAQQGFVHIDLDTMAKELLCEQPVQELLQEAYGSSICSADGSIDKARLAEIAFVDESSSEPLNGIIWPLVGKRLSDLIVGNSCQLNSAGTQLVVEIPLLAEAPDLIALADTILCITADESIRVERALARGMQLDDILRRMALQASDEQRAAISDVVIENNTSLAALYEKLDSWLELQRQEHMF